jgi:protein phosphatase
MQLRFGAFTDAGKVRARNEDRYVAEGDLSFFAVVDGMGGHSGGEEASITIAAALTEFIRETAKDADKTWPVGLDGRLSILANRLQVAIRSANRALASKAQSNADLDGSGATIAAALFEGGQLAVSNVGDCRAYLLRGGRLMQLTRDHSVVGEQLAQGLIDAEAARKHPLRHIVTRAVSGQSGMLVDVRELPVEAGDRIILCSDGIHGVLADNEIAAIFSAGDGSLEEACKAVVAKVNSHGGPDNATAVVVEVT